MLLFNFISDTDALTSAFRYMMETQKVQPYQNVVALESPESFQEFMQKMSGNKNVISEKTTWPIFSQIDYEERSLIRMTTTRLYVDATSFLFNIFNTQWTFDNIAQITRKEPGNRNIFHYENYVGENNIARGEKGETSSFYSLPFNFRGVSIKIETVTNAFSVLLDKLAERFPHTREMYVIFERKCSFTDPHNPKYIPVEDTHIPGESIHSVSGWVPTNPAEKVGGGTGHFFEVLFNDESRDHLTNFILQTIVTRVADIMANENKYTDISFYFDGPSASFRVPQKTGEEKVIPNYVPYPLRVKNGGIIVPLLRKNEKNDITPAEEQHFVSSYAIAGNYHFSDFVAMSVRAMYRKARAQKSIMEENITVITEEGNESVLFPLLYCYENYPASSYRVSGEGRIWLRYEWFNIFNTRKVNLVYAPLKTSGLKIAERKETEKWKNKSRTTLLTIDVIRLYDATVSSAFKTVHNMDAFISLFRSVKESPGHLLPFVRESSPLFMEVKRIPRYNWPISLRDVLVKIAIPPLAIMSNYEGVVTVNKNSIGLYTFLFVLEMQARLFMSDTEIKSEEQKILEYVGDIVSGKHVQVKRESLETIEEKEKKELMAKEFRKEKEIQIILLTSYRALMERLKMRTLFDPNRPGVLLSFVCFLMFMVEVTDPETPKDQPPRSVHMHLITREKRVTPDTLSNIMRLFSHVKVKFLTWLREKIENTPPQESPLEHCFNFPVLIKWFRSIINDRNTESSVLHVITGAYGYDITRFRAWDEMLGGTEKKSGVLFQSRVEKRTPEVVLGSNEVKEWLGNIQNRYLGYHVLKLVLDEVMPYLTPKTTNLYEMGVETMTNKTRWTVASNNVSWHPNYLFNARYLNYKRPVNPWFPLEGYFKKDIERFTRRISMESYEYINSFPKKTVHLSLLDEKLRPLTRWLQKGKIFEGKVTTFYEWFQLKGKMSSVASVSNYHLIKWFPFIASLSMLKTRNWNEVYTHIMVPFIQWTFQIPSEQKVIPDMTLESMRDFLQRQYYMYNSVYYDDGYLNFMASVMYNLKGDGRVSDIKGYFGPHLLDKESASEFVKISQALYELVRWSSEAGTMMEQNVIESLPFIQNVLFEGSENIEPLYSDVATAYMVLYRAVSTYIFGGVEYLRHETVEKGVKYPIEHVYATTFRPDPISPVFLDKRVPYVTFRLWQIDLPQWSKPPSWTKVLYPSDRRKVMSPYSMVVSIIPERGVKKEYNNTWKIPEISDESNTRLVIQRDPLCGKWFLALAWKFDHPDTTIASALIHPPLTEMFEISSDGNTQRAPKNESSLPFSRLALEWEILLRDKIVEMKRSVWQDHDWYRLWHQQILSNKGWIKWIIQEGVEEEMERYIKLFAIYLSQRRIRWYIDAQRDRVMFKTLYDIGKQRTKPRQYEAPSESWYFFPSKFKSFLLEHGVYREQESPIKVKKLNMQKDLLDWEFSVFLSSREVNSKVFQKGNRKFKELVESGVTPFLPYAEKTGVGLLMMGTSSIVANYEKITSLVNQMGHITDSIMHVTPEGKLSSTIKSNRVISITRQPAIFMNREWHATDNMNQRIFGQNFERAPIYNGMWYIVIHRVKKERAKFTFPGKIIGIAFELRNPLWNRVQLVNVMAQLDALADPVMETKPISEMIIGGIKNLDKWIEGEMKKTDKLNLYREGFKRWKALIRKIDQ